MRFRRSEVKIVRFQEVGSDHCLAEYLSIFGLGGQKNFFGHFWVFGPIFGTKIDFPKVWGQNRLFPGTCVWQGFGPF